MMAAKSPGCNVGSRFTLVLVKGYHIDISAKRVILGAGGAGGGDNLPSQ